MIDRVAIARVNLALEALQVMPETSQHLYGSRNWMSAVCEVQKLKLEVTDDKRQIKMSFLEAAA